MIRRCRPIPPVLATAMSLMVIALFIWGCATTEPQDAGGLTTRPEQTTERPEMTADKSAPPAGDDLLNTDCEKCHEPQPIDIATAGGKHKTAVTCRDCHMEHLPDGTQTIPQCSMCHEGESHFQLNNCLSCHENPHTPLKLNVADTPEVSIGCRSCHADKGEEFRRFPSSHAEQNCTLCHPKQHKVIKKCFSCHEPHSDSMQYEDCLLCHQPHSPTAIKPAVETPSSLCGSCHTDILAMLSHNTSKHAGLTCAYCHQGQHPTVPSCRDCHATPHSAGMLENFPDCLKCHNNPHDLSI